jgi:hypothetical protein
MSSVGQALLPVRFVCESIEAAIRRTLSLGLAGTEDRQECLSYCEPATNCSCQPDCSDAGFLS